MSKCAGASLNMGSEGCIETADAMVKGAFVATTDASGNRNSITTADTIDNTYISGMIQTGDKTNVSKTADSSKQWFVMPSIVEYNPETADDNTFDADGISFFVSDGVETVNFRILENASPQMLKALKSFRPKQMSYYSFSDSDQIVGNGKVSTDLRPFKIERNTLKAKLTKAKKLEPAYIDVSFQLAQTEKAEDMAHLSVGGGTIADDVYVTDYNGLIDVVMNPATAITATSFTVDMRKIYGDQGNHDAFKGAVAADFLFDGVAPTTVTESADGIYDFVVATFTGTQVLSFFKEKFSASQIEITI